MARAQRLSEGGLEVVAGRRVCGEVGLTHAEGDGIGAEDAPDGEGAEDGAGELGRPIDRQLPPGEAFGRREGEGDRRVDMAARDLADGIDERSDDETERKAD